MKKILFILALTACASNIQAEDIKVNALKYAGPYPMQQPFIVDETDVNAKKYSAETLIDTPLPLTDVFTSGHADIKGNDGISIPKSSAEHSLHLMGFTFQNNRYGKAKLTVEGLKKYQVFVEKSSVQLDVPRSKRDAAIESLCEEFVSKLEKYCKLYPYQWYNFYNFWLKMDDDK